MEKRKQNKICKCVVHEDNGMGKCLFCGGWMKESHAYKKWMQAKEDLKEQRK